VRAIAPCGRWYGVEARRDGVTHIVEPFVEDFFRCNIWHVAGRQKDLLIDTGIGVVSLTDQLGWLNRDRILAVATHSHFDHIGGHHEFANRACHRLEKEVLEKPTRANTLVDRYANLRIFEKLPCRGYEENAYVVAAAAPTVLLEHGDVIDLGNRQLQILHVPGHSPGSIALWEQETAILFSGDAIYDGQLIDEGPGTDISLYLDTMRRLRELPVAVVHGGHGPSFGRQRFHELIDAYVSSRRS
jgi:glyoxylase-like metal-dependent hydrolase (beta-lactamase superfamily II)